ncbi:MAG: hypothetical protein CL678_01540 [Bdellovibrionaceae bacterium]|nr:hypothetical protein [Pseudobdellovibrionaceae bacterium]|tara:strand:- start:711 stop:4940 length:4230 start_codon:yes stop_codon:yes gene_type:complete
MDLHPQKERKNRTKNSFTLDELLSALREATVEIEGRTWKVFYNSDFSETLASSGAFQKKHLESVLPLLKISEKSFAVQRSIQGVLFLLGIFPKEGVIRFYSSHLNNELLIYQEMGWREGRESQSLSAQWRAHVDALLSLDSSSFPSVIEQVTQLNGLSKEELSSLDESLKSQTKKEVDLLLKQMTKYSPSTFEKISDQSLNLTAQYALIRIHLLKFLVILPSLDHDRQGREVKKILLESIRRLLEDTELARVYEKTGQDAPIPSSLEWVLRVGRWGLVLVPAPILARLIRSGVRTLAKRFIAGESIETAKLSLKALLQSGRDVTLDQLGELVVSGKEADHYKDEVLKLIRGFSIHVPQGSRNPAGIRKAHVSIKLSALCHDFKPEAFEDTASLVGPRLLEILREAKKHQVFINVDAEHYDYRNVALRIFAKTLLENKELHDYADTGIVLQAYLRDGYKHFEEILALAKKRNIRMPIRIVKGAYWDAETIDADAHGYDAPQFLNKEETDIHFRQLVRKTLEHPKELQLCLASHNYSDHAYAEVLRKQMGGDIPVIEHQCLHMTYEALSTAMASHGYVVRNYVPVGSLIVGMAYLVRRIMENSSQVGVLTIMRSHHQPRELKSPAEVHQNHRLQKFLSFDGSVNRLTSEFRNVAPLRLYLDEDLEALNEGIRHVESLELGEELSSGGAGALVEITSPSDPKKIVGKIHWATPHDVEKTVSQMRDDFSQGSWSQSPALHRALVLMRAAQLLHMKRNKMAAWISMEAGKTLKEAAADVDEAIDFLNFYSREAIQIQKRHSRWIPRGVITVIAPWNFPLAIPCGMVSAALAAGNSVILKSAEQTPLVTQKMIDLFIEAGVPKEVLAHLPGPGETVGQALLSHPGVSGYVFTGSKPVGLKIAHEAGVRLVSHPQWGFKSPTKVIAEMGGKNAVIVTANADLDEAVSGILQSAFIHAGQKCSAASRVIVDERIRKQLLKRLEEACLDIKVGHSLDYATTINPIISQEDQNRLRKEAKKASEEALRAGGKVWVDRSEEKVQGHQVGPVLIELPFAACYSKESYFQKELFGPILHVTGFKSASEAVDLFNSTEYALTGGVFSQSQDELDYYVQRLEVGNLYLNRTITGARVAIEPFGGFKHSGTGPKAGSHPYLSAFYINPRSVIGTPRQTPTSSESLTSIQWATPSFVSDDERIHVGEKLIRALAREGQSFFGSSAGRERLILSQLRKWIRKELRPWWVYGSLNRVIPGQKNLNNFAKRRENTLLLLHSDEPDLSSWIHAIVSLVQGSGLTVLSLSELALIKANRMKKMFVDLGGDPHALQVFGVTPSQAEEACRNLDLQTFILDGVPKNLEQSLKWIYSNAEVEPYMRSILTPFDAFYLLDPKSLFEQHVHVRTLAINLMRHGAPMDIDLVNEDYL